jgi:hypothetical protein
MKSKLSAALVAACGAFTGIILANSLPAKADTTYYYTGGFITGSVTFDFDTTGFSETFYRPFAPWAAITEIHLTSDFSVPSMGHFLSITQLRSLVASPSLL